MSEDESTPLDDLRDVRKIATAMKDGVVVDRASLPIHRALTER